MKTKREPTTDQYETRSNISPIKHMSLGFLSAILLLAISMIWMVWQPLWLAPPILEHTAFVYLLPLLLSLFAVIFYLVRISRIWLRICLLCLLILFSCGLWVVTMPGVIWVGFGDNTSATHCHSEVQDENIQWTCRFSGWFGYHTDVEVAGRIESPFVHMISYTYHFARDY